MLNSLRASFAVAAPHLPVRALVSAGTLGAFGWLLSQDLIHPLVIYIFELYLSF